MLGFIAKRTGIPFDLLAEAEPAMLKAIQEESTSWRTPELEPDDG